MTPLRLATATSAALLTAISLASCSGSSSADEVETVDATDFASDKDTTVFRLEKDGTTCRLSPESAPNGGGIFCTLPMDDDIPGVQYGLPTVAQAAVWYDDDKAFLPVGGLDGVPLEPEAPVLHPDQRISVDGITCTAGAGNTLKCERRGESFEYDDGTISTTTWRSPWSGPKDSCGALSGGEFPDFDGADLQVTLGIVDCDDALRTVNEYLSKPVSTSGGNSNMTELDDWTCSIPSWGVSRETGMMLSCGTEDELGRELSVGVPLTESDSASSRSVSARESCGVADKGLYGNLTDTEVKVESGDVNCTEAVSVVEEYLSEPAHDGSFGASPNKTVQGWNCKNQTVWGGPADGNMPPMLRCSVADKVITVQGTGRPPGSGSHDPE
ncbi:hypothetical protein [uncultured Corynebacterium sp.]|uniref:hypothetical protein n=1 Tax=uncultured Corynebacterium sp. TaxID=159447 RepID=UPI0025D36AF7|nr:hypothetical protein [uncultured Corynebacterium sp.]